MKNFDLKIALAGYEPFDTNEKKHLEKTIDFIKNNDNLYSRSNLKGHINGSAYLLSSDLSKVLLMHHKALNDWFQFGGHSDGNPDTLDVAMRETIEESGIKNFRLLHEGVFDISANTIPYSEKKKEPEHIHYDIYFAFSTDNLDFISSDESNDLRWFSMDEYMALPQNEQRNRFVAKWQKLKKLT